MSEMVLTVTEEGKVDFELERERTVTVKEGLEERAERIEGPRLPPA